MQITNLNNPFFSFLEGDMTRDGDGDGDRARGGQRREAIPRHSAARAAPNLDNGAVCNTAPMLHPSDPTRKSGMPSEEGRQKANGQGANSIG